MNKYVKFPLVLGLVALVSGALLSGTYHLTKDKIEQGRIDRQTSAINDLFTTISSKSVVEIPVEFASKGISSIVEVVSAGKTYKCYTVNYKDAADGDPISVIIALNESGKVHGVKFVTVDSYIRSNYNNETYLATVVKNDKFDAVTNATVTAGDLNAALKLAKDCFKGKVSNPVDELFTSVSSKQTITVPTANADIINTIYRVVSNGSTYYVFDTTFTDTISKDTLNVLYALNNDGTLYKVKIVEGDYWSKQYDGSTTLDSVSHATASGIDLNNKLAIVQECLEEVK